MMLTGYIAGRVCQPNMGPVEEVLHFENCRVVENVACLNASLTIISTADKAIPIKQLQINSIAQNDFDGLTIYINGSSVECAVSPLWVIQHGDSLMVNLVFPCTNSTVSSLHDSGF